MHSNCNEDENNGNENNDSAADEALDRAELIEKTGEVTSQMRSILFTV